MRTSEFLTPGQIYNRNTLQEKFGIRDATIKTGIFRPRGHDSVWLFITEEKTPDRVQYKDSLQGDDLFFEGQRAGSKDRLLITHKDEGLEVLLFHRENRFKHPSAGFVYEGRFTYVNHHGSGPTRFHFRRVH